MERSAATATATSAMTASLRPFNSDLQRPNEKPRTVRTINPQILRGAINVFLINGQEFFEESVELDRLINAMQKAKRSGYTIDQFYKDLDQNILDLRKKSEGPSMGSEPIPMDDVRGVLTTKAEDIWTNPSA